jgi:hypothetical protein
MSIPLGEDATTNARRMRDKKNIKWRHPMPCSRSALEPPLIVELLARHSANSGPWDTREQLMALDVADPMREVVELFRVGDFLLRLVELSCDVVAGDLLSEKREDKIQKPATAASF